MSKLLHKTTVYKHIKKRMPDTEEAIKHLLSTCFYLSFRCLRGDNNDSGLNPGR